MNRPQHMLAGSLTAASIYLALTHSYNEKSTLKGFIYSLGGGALVGVLPDLIEPATSGNHRGFFHSLTFATLLGYIFYKRHSNENIGNAMKIFFGVIGSAYGSHLALDSMTPRRLPLLLNDF